MTPRILRTTRRLPKEMVLLERFEGLDDQGKSDYSPGEPFEANVAEYDVALFSRGAEFAATPDGSRVRTPLTLYVQGDAAVVPNEQDRVALADGRRFIVVERTPFSGLRHTRSEPDHYRLRCRVE